VTGKITPKQAKFVQEYLLDLNGTQAAIRAGYSPPTAQEQSARLLSNVIVKDVVAQAQAIRAEKVELDQDWVLRRLKLISDRCIQATPVLNANGDETGEWKFEPAGANKATELIGKHLGMFVDRMIHSGEVAVCIIDDIGRVPSDKP
jgi:phage terminase small subunit